MVDEKKLDDLLLDLGYSDNLAGTSYIRAAVSIYEFGRGITKDVYPTVAQQFKTSPTRVERAIRHSTERAFARAGYARDAATAVFGNSVNPKSGYPTNGELIARLSRLTKQK